MRTSVTSVKSGVDIMLMLASHLHCRMTGSHEQVALSICGAPYTS